MRFCAPVGWDLEAKARAGTLLPLLRITIDPEARSYVINAENAAPSSAACAASDADATPSLLRCDAEACEECVRLPGCGWSTVRRGCLPQCANSCRSVSESR